ncbi:MAG TPA: hypothetical protein VHN18_02965 [Micromonosporaceae bacterium]|nr:hypothetical protein [Micromonosporaceae bacterium]
MRTTLIPPEVAVAPAEGNPRRQRVGYLAAAWAALYGMLALVWTLTGGGYPFGPNDLQNDNNQNEVTLLRLLPADVGAPVFAAILLIAAVVTLAMAGNHSVRLRGLPRLALLAYAWLVAAALLVVVPDVEILALAGYAPMLIIGAPFGWPDIDYAAVFDWTLLNKGLAVLGGVLIAYTVLGWQGRTAGSRGSRGAWTSATSVARWGRWAAYVAAAIPVSYAVTRFAWLAGIALGLSEPTLRGLRDSGGVWAGAGLGTFAVVGAILTLGLTQRWGEVFPRWMPGLAGRRVPILLAVVPASFVTIAVAAAGMAAVSTPRLLGLAADLNAAFLPMLLWPLGAVALGAATVAYYLRRHGTDGTDGTGGTGGTGGSDGQS